MACLLTVCTPALSCDLEALRHYPMTKALENRAVPLRMPDLFFKSDASRDFDRFSLDAAGAAEMRASLPEAHRWIIVVRIFEAEMLNGSAHQAFFNSSGVLAPDVAAALKAMNLPEHAAAVERGIAMFPWPYPRDTEKRRAFMGTQNEAFDTRLGNLTGAVDDGAMHEAMIATARAADILPK